MNTVDKLVKELAEEIQGTKPLITGENVGYISEIKDEVVFLEGFDGVTYGEVINFSHGVRGLVVDLQEDTVGAIVFGDFLELKEGDEAHGTGQIFNIPVSDAYLGRVVDGLGNPIDGGGAISAEKNYPVERIAPGVVTRHPVTTPLQTGIKAIDAVIPIGRGQRELIIGDRGTGKSTIAIDTILNQKDVVCIYNIIGQKRSNTAVIVELLSKSGALKNTVVVASTASDPASMQYISPYVACTIGEYFMDQGRDVLVVYDDLSKHAWAGSVPGFFTIKVGVTANGKSDEDSHAFEIKPDDFGDTPAQPATVRV
jgi:F-type H+-transporting ATPase subunit alpha